MPRLEWMPGDRSFCCLGLIIFLILTEVEVDKEVRLTELELMLQTGVVNVCVGPSPMVSGLGGGGTIVV